MSRREVVKMSKNVQMSNVQMPKQLQKKPWPNSQTQANKQ